MTGAIVSCLSRANKVLVCAMEMLGHLVGYGARPCSCFNSNGLLSKGLSISPAHLAKSFATGTLASPSGSHLSAESDPRHGPSRAQLPPMVDMVRGLAITGQEKRTWLLKAS